MLSVRNQLITPWIYEMPGFTRPRTEPITSVSPYDNCICLIGWEPRKAVSYWPELTKIPSSWSYTNIIQSLTLQHQTTVQEAHDIGPLLLAIKPPSLQRMDTTDVISQHPSQWFEPLRSHQRPSPSHQWDTWDQWSHQEMSQGQTEETYHMRLETISTMTPPCKLLSFVTKRACDHFHLSMFTSQS